MQDAPGNAFLVEGQARVEARRGSAKLRYRLAAQLHPDVFDVACLVEIPDQRPGFGHLAPLQIEAKRRLLRQQVRPDAQFAVPRLKLAAGIGADPLGFGSCLGIDRGADGAHPGRKQEHREQQHQPDMAGEQELG
jgi:hypothetical protein